MTVPRDSGHDFIDQNGHRMNRRFTLLPLIEAVQTVTARKKVAPKFDWSSVDFVTDRTGLRKLVAWANSKSDDWRIDTQLAGDKTILINAWSSVTKQSSGQSESYGFNFEKACTHPAPGCESGTGHHRIVTYVRALYSSEHAPVLIADRILVVSGWSSVSKWMPAYLSVLPRHTANPAVPRVP